MKSGKPLPPPLSSGDLVGVWVPASAPRRADVEAGVAVLHQAGFRVLVARNFAEKRGYLAGDDRTRLFGLEELLDAGAKAIWAVRGGYGVMRLFPGIPWDRLAAWNGWFVGYSDITAFHCAALKRYPWATVHGPMITALDRHNQATKRVLALVQGRVPKPLFRFGPEAVLRPGAASGTLVGGNLSLLAALVGTEYEPPWEDTILALEDVGEPGYRLDRTLTQLALAGCLDGVQGVLAGSFAGCGRGEHEWREIFAERLLALTADSCPVVMGLPFGHIRRNLAFPIGIKVTLDTYQGIVRMED